MTKTFILKRMAVLVGVVALAAAIGFTYSAFNDEEKAAATFSTGTLDLNLSKNGGSADAVFNAANILPGQEVEGEIDLDNSGTMPVNGIMLSADSE